MDEPFAALDALTRREMQEDLLQLWGQLRFTLVFVTHAIDEAIVLGSRVLVLSPHPGRVRAEIDVERFGFDALGHEEFGRVRTPHPPPAVRDGGGGVMGPEARTVKRIALDKTRPPQRRSSSDHRSYPTGTTRSRSP